MEEIDIEEIKQDLALLPYRDGADIEIGLLGRLCSEITKSKGFDVTQYATQTALIATEVAEALEELDSDCQFSYHLRNWAANFEHHRKHAEAHKDTSTIRNLDNHIEELADIQIRLMSYVWGNEWGDKFMGVMIAKMKKNAERPHKHGKGF